MPFLVDTHAFLWFVFADDRLSRHAEEMLTGGDRAVLSVVSLWEIAVKLTIDKLRLGMSYPDFLIRCVLSREIDVLSIELPHLIEYVQLPMHHRDPFDRLLIAQGRAEGLPVVTADKRFGEYGIEISW